MENIFDVNLREKRLGKECYNNQGCLMKIIEYNSVKDIIIEFQDKYKYKKHCSYEQFTSGRVKNPYAVSVCGVGILGDKYPAMVNRKHTKEYQTWRGILRRCFNNSKRKRNATYVDVICCDEWLCYETFYEWLHSQSNFSQWLHEDKWHIDKDIIVKGNKIYSPETCCLVPSDVNMLFIKSNATRGELPIGVHKHGNNYIAQCNMKNEKIYLGTYDTVEKAFVAYKKYKENIIKQIAKTEYSKGNITEICYNAMMNYKVEITD